MQASARIQKWVEARFLALTQPLCALLAKRRVHPDLVTACGFFLSLAAGILYGAGLFFAGGIVVLAAGICDSVDGRLARQTGRAGKRGAFFDSTLDRLGEIGMFSGLAWHFAGLSASGSARLMLLLTLLALAGSLMVSYVRARAEGLGLDCKVGLMQRQARMFLLIVGSLTAALPVVGRGLMNLIIGLLAVLTAYSVWQRFQHVLGQLPPKETSGGPVKDGD